MWLHGCRLKTKPTLSAPITASTLLDQVEFYRLEAASRLDPSRQSELGQYFSAAPIARFMSSMFTARPDTLEILDAGAGVGILAAATVAAALGWKKRPQRINVTAYEVEPVLLDHLQATMDACAVACQVAGAEFAYTIHTEDFITAAAAQLASQGGLFAKPAPAFNCAILNPPYHKINNTSATRQMLRAVGIETSNLYTAFVWLVLRLLAPRGELVAITPRSFCNGPYFRPFRLALLESMALRRIHVFASRTDAFQADEVLQENIIFHATKTDDQPETVAVTTSESPDDPLPTVRKVPYHQVVEPGDENAFVHIVPDELSHQIGQQMRGLSHTLEQLGLTVSTGRVVDFRARELLRPMPEAGTVPLIWPAHFSGGHIAWPRETTRKPNALALGPKADELLVPAGYYVLVKRLTSKEEKRRVVAAVYDPTRIPGDQVGFENHLNYFHRQGAGLDAALAEGLSAYLNSSLVDQFFRRFNGHTQVNATDLRSLTYPSEDQLQQLGRRIGGSLPEQSELDQIVMEALNMTEQGEGDAPIQAKRRITEATAILKALGLPRQQINDRSALTLLGLLNVKPHTPWDDAEAPLVRTLEIMAFARQEYGVNYAANTRETIRRHTLHQFLEAGLVDINPDNRQRPTNSPKTCYQIELAALALIQSFGSPQWETLVASFLQANTGLRSLRAKERDMALVPVKTFDGQEVRLTPGGQNNLIAAILTEFCQRFTPGGTLAYIDDAGEKLKAEYAQYLATLGVTVDEHGKMPDVIVHMPDKPDGGWLILIEAVTSHGPINIMRHSQLKTLFSTSKAGLVFVTAFETRQAMLEYLREIAWETEVWLAEAPSHIIHFNGERFLGPYGANN